MRAFVFTDEALRDQAGQFVWLEINTERAKNAAFRKQFPAQALPTYLVIDPKSEQVLLRWVGGTSVTQLEALLEDSRSRLFASQSTPEDAGATEAAQAAEAAKGSSQTGTDVAADAGAVDEKPGSANALLGEADLLYGAGDNAGAAIRYEQALAAAPDAWASYGRAVEALLLAWSLDGKCEPASRLAREAHPRLAQTSSAATVLGVGLDCSLERDETDSLRPALVAYFEDEATRAVADLSIPMADDDRSGVYISLLSARQAVADTAGALGVAVKWSAFLDGAASRAANPESRTVFDSHRLSAYIELGQPERAIPMLEQSAADFPDDYNPPARLAIAYRAMKRWPEALEASQRAIDRAYGPRLTTILRTRAEIYLAQGDPASAKTTLEAAIAQAESLPDGQRSDGTIKALRERLGSLQIRSAARP